MSSFFRSFQRLLRKKRPNRRVARFARRATSGRSFSLGGPTKEHTRLWRVLVWGAVALVLCQVEAGVLPHLGARAVAIDVPLLIVTFGALQLGAIEGAIAAYVLGWIGDLFVQGPPGLCRFMAVAVWTGVRVASTKVHLPARIAPVAFTFAAGLVYEAGILAGLALVAEGGAGPGTIAWLSVVPQAVLTAIAALPLHAGLARLETWTEGVRG
jgi:hypothetical protein